jgi:Uncharacterized protein conserved in bacteria (DUF2252)
VLAQDHMAGGGRVQKLSMASRGCQRRRERGFATRQLFAAICVVLIGASPALAQLRPEPEALDLAPPELVERLRTDPYVYFRFVNRPWISRVCDVFAEDMRGLPTVRLHGDAHVEQYAMTKDAWGLDDFDDSARGPALIDIVRFLGSIDLAARQRGWIHDREALFNQFFSGYRRGLLDPDYQSPEPDIVRVMRARTPRSETEFLAWGESHMEPMIDASVKAVVAGMDAFSALLYRERPDLAPGYFVIVHAGWLRMGVGSALGNKILIRVQGPSTDPADDELLEAKELRYLGGLRCLENPPTQPTLRVIQGVQQLGRLRHNILAAGPELAIPEAMVRGRRLRDWWIRSWDSSYRELRLDDLRSVKDLAAIVYDSGVQLGAGSLADASGPQGTDRKQAWTAIARLEKRIRKETLHIVEQLLLGWRELAAR